LLPLAFLACNETGSRRLGSGDRARCAPDQAATRRHRESVTAIGPLSHLALCHRRSMAIAAGGTLKVAAPSRATDVPDHGGRWAHSRQGPASVLALALVDVVAAQPTGTATSLTRQMSGVRLPPRPPWSERCLAVRLAVFALFARSSRVHRAAPRPGQLEPGGHRFRGGRSETHDGLGVEPQRQLRVRVPH
jgi:hypothetical protein